MGKHRKAKPATVDTPSAAYLGMSGKWGKINDLLRVMTVHRKLAKKALYSLVFARTRMAYADFEDALNSALRAEVLEERIEGNVVLIILEPKTNAKNNTK